MTVSLAVIMFELTGGLRYAVPTVVSIMFSKWVGDAFSPDSIHEEYINLYDMPYLDNKRNIPATDLCIADCMTTSCQVLSCHGHTIDTLQRFLADLPFSGYPVVTTEEDGTLIGYIRSSDLLRTLATALVDPKVTRDTQVIFGMLELRFPRNAPFVDLRPALDRAPIQVVEKMSMEKTMHMFRTLGLQYCLITKFGKLKGILTKKDVLRIFKT